jgi:transcriptional regulator with XRE-family HTH domain
MARPSLVRTNIARLRLALGMNQEQFARFIRRSTACVQSLELARLRLSAQLASELAQRTGVNQRWLLDNKLDEPPYDITGKPWSTATYNRLQNEIPVTEDGDEVFRQRLLEVATQLTQARNVAGMRRLYRAFGDGRDVLEIGRRIDQFLSSLMIELDLRPDLNMIEEIRFAEREAERKSQNVLRLMGVAQQQQSAAARATMQPASETYGQLAMTEH